ncbi:unnamed protein product [Rotaria sp. Silwood1]|nr:unnamed protein product [Rotaria sp. Silwood1]
MIRFSVPPLRQVPGVERLYPSIATESHANMDDESVQFGIQDETPLHNIPTDFDISNIRKIKIADGSLINCECAIRIDNDMITQSEVLDTLLSGALHARGQSLREHRLFNLDENELEALTKAQRKIGHNDQAKETIEQSFKFERRYKEALTEKTLIEQKANREQRLAKEKAMEQQRLDEERILLERPKLITASQTNEIRRTHDRSLYNILSIDGGGFRGVMPAIWLTAIERGTRRHCSSIFQMLAGTSTGAIIACGLSMPPAANNTEPIYTARDIVYLYNRHASDIFVPATRRRLIYRWCTQSSRYSRIGRELLFKKYFEGALICNSLTDVVVPAVQADHTRTYLFTRYDSRTGNIRPASIVDILMSTTAAPTYFRPHAFDYSAYVDGGVQMNNPTIAAYSEALRYGCRSEDIFVLSLGTGDYVHDPLRWPTASHYQMNLILGQNNYHRWQVWFEDEIPLDEYSTETQEILEDHAYTFLEELEARDDNKRLGAILERLS